MRCVAAGVVPIHRAYAPTSSLTMPTSRALEGRTTPASRGLSRRRIPGRPSWARPQAATDRADASPARHDRAQRNDPGRAHEDPLAAVPEPFADAEQARRRHDRHAVLFRERTAKV